MAPKGRPGSRDERTPAAASEYVYGRQAVRETLRAGRRKVYGVYLGEGVRQTDIVSDIVRLSKRAIRPLKTVERRTLDQLTEDANHQGVAAEVAPYPYVGEEALLRRAEQAGQPPFLLILDHLQDPQNIGTLLRAAEAAGVHGIVIPDRRAASITPAVSNASSGAVEHLFISRVTNLVQYIASLKRSGVWIAGLEGKPDATLYTEAALSGAIALVLGSEGEGLSRGVRDACDLLVRLPMAGQVGSLNASTAGAIAVYEVLRQRGLTGFTDTRGE